MKKILASLLALGFVYVSITPINAVLAETSVSGDDPAEQEDSVTGNDPAPEVDPEPEVDPVDQACSALEAGFCEADSRYWFEGGKRQGVYGDPKNIIDIIYHVERGREIYDPVSDAWYWLDADSNGAKATGKEVWMPYIYQNEDEWDAEKKAEIAHESDLGLSTCVLSAMLEKKGKWVRYDENGAMLKGWVTIEGKLADLYPDQEGNVYYYDHRTGLMAKGVVTIDGVQYHFNEETGVRE